MDNGEVANCEQVLRKSKKMCQFFSGHDSFFGNATQKMLPGFVGFILALQGRNTKLSKRNHQIRNQKFFLRLKTLRLTMPQSPP
jgi:hypothetical protein